MRICPHGEDITQSICRSDLAEDIGVVNDGAELVHGIDSQLRPVRVNYCCVIG